MLCVCACMYVCMHMRRHTYMCVHVCLSEVLNCVRKSFYADYLKTVFLIFNLFSVFTDGYLNRKNSFFLLFILKDFCLVRVCVWLCLWLCVCSKKPKENIGSSGARVKCSCKQPDVSARKLIELESFNSSADFSLAWSRKPEWVGKGMKKRKD